MDFRRAKSEPLWDQLQAILKKNNCLDRNTPGFDPGAAHDRITHYYLYCPVFS